MKLTEQLTDYVHAAFSGLWVQTREARRGRTRDPPARPPAAVEGRRLGHRQRPAPARPCQRPTSESAAGDPLAALRALPALADRNGTALLLLHNFHRYLTNPEVVQTTFTQLVAGKQQRTFLVVLSPVVQIPVELEKLFVVLEHALPDREQLEGIARELTSDSPTTCPRATTSQRVLDAAAGLTRYEAEGAFALSLTRHNAIRPEAIWELKAQTLKKNNLLTLHRGGECFDTLGGLPTSRTSAAAPCGPARPSSHGHPAAWASPASGKSLLRQGPGQRDGPAHACSSTSARCTARWSAPPRPTSARPCASPTP